jgi:hypothetical protein
MDQTATGSTDIVSSDILLLLLSLQFHRRQLRDILFLASRTWLLLQLLLA